MRQALLLVLAASSAASADPSRVAYFDRGALAMRNGRLHFTAFVGGLPNKTTRPPLVELLSAGKVVASMPLRADDAWDDVFICRGVSAFRWTNGISYDEACSFPGVASGSYTLAIEHGGQRIAEEQLSIVENRHTDGSRFLVVRPRDRTEQGLVNEARTVYWHQVDVRNDIESLQLIWMNGDTVERPPEHAHSEPGHNAFAKIGPLWEDDTPLVDAVPIEGPAPHAEWTSPRLRLVVFRNGRELLATHRLEVVEPGQVAMLRPAADVTQKQIQLARAEAKEIGDEPLERRSWPEEVVCDVVSNPKRLADLNAWVHSTRSAQAGVAVARDKEKAAREGWRTEEERRGLRAHAKRLRDGAATKDAHARSLEVGWRTLGNGYKKGCFEKLAPIR